MTVVVTEVTVEESLWSWWRKKGPVVAAWVHVWLWRRQVYGGGVDGEASDI